MFRFAVAVVITSATFSIPISAQTSSRVVELERSVSELEMKLESMKGRTASSEMVELTRQITNLTTELEALKLEPAKETDTKKAPATQIAAVTVSPSVVFERLTVTGGPTAIKEIPGSATYLSEQVLQEQSYGDIHRLLRQVPGVNIQEEDGYGLRPNIGMRGTGVERSEKITLMEDGILIAPAPYSAPAAYYFPSLGRMEGVEVRKGSTSIRQGPYTTGGALNLISSSIPSQFGGKVNIAAGQNGTIRGHLLLGDSGERYGWMFETFQNVTDGFKKLDGGGDTGFKLHDYLGKARWTSSSRSRVHQVLELKLGHTTQTGDETYLGLTEADFDQTPYRRYAASAADLLDTEHEQLQLRHLLAPGANWDVTTTVYRNDFFRNWHKLDTVGGVAIATLLASPQQYESQVAIMRGEKDGAGSLVVRNNRRDYYAQGVQSVVASRFRAGRVSHELETGVRYHTDGEDRFQEDDRYSMIGGHAEFTLSGVPGSNANRTTDAKALAFFVQDQMRFGRWIVTPGVRIESVDFEIRDFGRNDPDRTGSSLAVRRNSVDGVIPGIGIAFDATPSLTIFGGAHKGFAPPGAGANAETRPEESVNYETGFRWTGALAKVEAIGFFNDYDNLLGRDTLSTGGTGSGDLFNGGKVQVRGIEAAIDREISVRSGLVPVRLAYTWTDATFRNSFETAFADWAPRVSAGDEIPYIPEHQLTVNAGWEISRWSAYAQLSWVDAMRTTAGRGPITSSNGTEGHSSVDLTIAYDLASSLELYVQGRNITDETYVVARRPAGLRPGMPRTFLTGVSWKF